jgi:hypothetical protein
MAAGFLLAHSFSIFQSGNFFLSGAECSHQRRTTRSFINGPVDPPACFT